MLHQCPMETGLDIAEKLRIFIQEALEENRFCLYSQAIVPIDKSNTSLHKYHYEILVRMKDEMGKLIPPMAFIPAAERYGLMPALDRWIINSFFSNYHKLVGEDREAIYTINLSGATLTNDQFLDFLQEQFAIFQIPPEIICFEITETAAIANLSKAVHFINELKKIGCSFALDDFGSGMSSFAYLKNLPVDYLKIDGHFIKDIISDPIDRAMVDSINLIGHVMGIKTIAEFVENDEIMQLLKTLGIDYAQGYGIAKPRLLF